VPGVPAGVASCGLVVLEKQERPKLDVMATL